MAGKTDCSILSIDWDDLDKVESTQDIVRAAVKTSKITRLDKAPFLPVAGVTAKHQTAGRGRMKRKWEDLPGNLMLSIGFLYKRTFADFPIHASHSAACAIWSAAVGFLPEKVSVRRKWPNDVLANGRKFAGILVETIALDGDLSGLAIGVGVNVTTAPSSVPESVALTEYSKVSLGEFRSAFLGQLDRFLAEPALTRATYSEDIVLPSTVITPHGKGVPLSYMHGVITIDIDGVSHQMNEGAILTWKG